MNTMIEQRTGADVYAARILETLSSGFVSLMISIGHRTGLFDVMAALPPSPSWTIAGAAGLSERYVQEWLSAMTAAQIVEHDPRTDTFFMSIEYAAVLARSAGADSLAPIAQMVAQLGAVEDLVVAGFRSGGGVTTEAYDALRDLTWSEKRRALDEAWVESVLALAPGMRQRLVAGATVLDAGCGDGSMLNLMARMFPRSLFRGYDIAANAIARASEQAAEAELTNVDFAVGDIATLDEARAYDLVLALESVHELGFPRIALRRLLAALKRDGVFVMQEVAASTDLARNADHPLAPMLYAFSTMHSIPVALSQDGEALGRLWGREKAAQYLEDAGFRNLRCETIRGDKLHDYFIATR